MKENYIILGSILKSLREDDGYSRNNLASIIGISSTELKRVEEGKIPSLNTLLKITNQLRIDLNRILSLAGLLIYDEENNDEILSSVVIESNCLGCKYYCNSCCECTYEE